MSNQNKNKQVTPKLVCNVTGKSRVTNRKYLQSKADKKNITVEEFLAYYVSKDVLRQLKAGRTVAEIRAEYPKAPNNELSNDWAAQAVKVNGKNGPSGPHAKTQATQKVESLSPEVEKLVRTVQEKESSVEA